MGYVTVMSWGLVSLSACAPADTSIEDITHEVNLQQPTGISSRWALSEDKTFSGGQPNPCPCEQDLTRLHYLFNC